MKFCYALLLAMAAGLPVFAQDSLPVRLPVGVEIFPENYTKILENVPESVHDLMDGMYVRYVQCYHIPDATQRAALEKEGLRFLAYVPFGTYLVAIPEGFDLVKLQAINPRSLVEVQPGWKMAQSLRELPYGDWAVHGGQVDINIQVYPHVGIPRGAALCRQSGFSVLLEGNQNGFLQIRLPQDKIIELAAMPWVQSLELIAPPAEPDDTRGRGLHRSNLLDSGHPSGLKFNGDGVSVLVRDDGPLGPHIDYRGRLFNNTEPGADGTHGDGVGGILAGAGNLDPTKKGMATGANVYAIRYTPDFQDQTLPLHLDKNVTITNTSYSNGCNVGYTLAAQTVDQQMFQHPTLTHVFSAGNSNNISNCLSYGAGNQWGNITGGHKMAKNAVVTANLMPDGTLVTSSSRGPAYDGRLKPDISANGNDQESTDQDNAYFVFGGTSAAAPGIAGVLAQLTQAYKTMHGGQEPRSVLLKAAMLNTANDLGNTGPDFMFGWGHVNAWRAYRLLEQNNWLEGQVDQAGSATHNVEVPAGTRQLRVMICWADPPASVNAARALTNDLDLQVLTSDGAARLPWKLNPAPGAVALNLPAAKGRDSLNNVEQVSVDDPAPGNYSVTVSGAEVPFGPQTYVLVWEFVSDNVRITYPAGGEGLVPGEVERIHWDAYGNQGVFSLRYSTDDGFSWQQIADVPGDKRLFDWQVPDVLSGRVRLQIQRGLASYLTEFPLSIVPVPENIQVEKVCPHTMTISWNPAKDTLPSDVYLLGAKYMEIVGSVASNTCTFPIQNGGSEKWVSVRARNTNGLTGRRAVAVQWPGELKNCTQPDDLGVRTLLSPGSQPVYVCAPYAVPVTVLLKNEGLNAVSGAVLNYQVDNKPVVSQSVPNIPAAGSLTFTFQTPIQVTENGVLNLRVWSTYAAEDAPFNDTLLLRLPTVVKPKNEYFTEQLESFEFPPFGWLAGSDPGSLTWLKSASNIPGADGQPTDAIVYYYYYDAMKSGYLDMFPVDLNGIVNPGLTFQVAHAETDSGVTHLRVEVYPACNLAAQPVVIWQKTDPALHTTSSAAFSFVPQDGDDWRTEAVSLNQFSGQKVIIRFVAWNSQPATPGDNLYLDNIGIADFNVSQPFAQFSVSADTTCLADTVFFAATPTGGNFTNYEWFYGLTAQPPTSVGPGPHAVRFLTTGTKPVRLIVKNILGADTMIRNLKVFGNPAASFSTQLNGLQATFDNTSLNAFSYFWEFGDGSTSMEQAPVHVYAMPGVYTVKLTALNLCGTSAKSTSIDFTTGTNGPEAALPLVRIVPNPGAGDFRVELESRESGVLDMTLLGIGGRMLHHVEQSLKPGHHTVFFEHLNLSKGVYVLRVRTGSAVGTFRVIVQ